MTARTPSFPAGPSPGRPILFYDGACSLCQKAVRFLLRIDHQARLRFAPLQGPTAQLYLKSRGLSTTDFDSLIFLPDWRGRETDEPQFRTDAILSALAAIGRGWRLTRVLRVLPQGLRDTVYRVIARFRYRLFGPYRPSPLPRPEWAERFLP